MGLKLDMAKANDYIEKDYIEVTLQAFGFHKEFKRMNLIQAIFRSSQWISFW